MQGGCGFKEFCAFFFFQCRTGAIFSDKFPPEPVNGNLHHTLQRDRHTCDRSLRESLHLSIWVRQNYYTIHGRLVGITGCLLGTIRLSYDRFERGIFRTGLYYPPPSHLFRTAIFYNGLKADLNLVLWIFENSADAFFGCLNTVWTCMFTSHQKNTKTHKK